MKEENIGVLSAGERFGFKGFEWIVLDNNVDGGVLAIMASAWNNEEYIRYVGTRYLYSPG